MSREIGKVLGTADAQPLDFWVAVPAEELLQLDDVVMVRRTLASRQVVTLYGIVDILVARHEGARLDSDVFLAMDGVLPLTHTVKAHVTVTRVEPEIFIPPLPGEPVLLAAGAERDRALFFDGMTNGRFPLGLSRSGEPAWGNFEFLNGSRGAHLNISGISGVATKTTYATFLLYGIFNSGLLGAEETNTHALIFNVKGEDLLFLDKPNNALTPERAELYAKLNLKPGVFDDVAIYAPTRKDELDMIPDTGMRTDVNAFAYTIKQFCEERLLKFLFTEAEDDSSQLGSVVERVESALAREDVRGFDSFHALVDFIRANLDLWAGNYASGTRSAFERRLLSAAARVGHLIRGRVNDAERNTINWRKAQVTVIDIHNLHDRAKRFVIGVVLKRMFEDKEKAGSNKPLVFVVLDELNKYAPREGWSPIKDVILDMAERGRSLGVILIGAEQTASQIERRVVANSSFRVVGRLDMAEAQQHEYAFLPGPSRARAGILKPGTVIVSQPEIPIPLLVQFPFPSWATRPSEALTAVGAGKDPFRKFRT
ncbi:MAG TPA: ATP-binding protein [Bryobacteraceae bacterium]|nr:ATP-binding protein [Bryobacteraceae bacterium]